ncbi:MAG: hypothetical protein MJE77_30335 [Proteobacteria bacterium]|nr:hypothetical protein [Pseudomonadota bacterium]
MALPYTTGLPEPQETMLAQAIVRRLEQLHGTAGLFLAHVGQTPASPASVDDDAFSAVLERVRGQAPAALVAIESATVQAGGMTDLRERWSLSYDVVVFIYCAHRRSVVEGRLDPDSASKQDDTKDPGIRAITELVNTLLIGWPLTDEHGKEIATLYEMQPQGWRTVFADAGGTARELRYRVLADQQRDPWPGVTDYLEAVEATYSRQPGDSTLMQSEVPT